MSTVTFKYVQIANFLGLKSGKLDLHNQGLVLIRGENDDSSANSNGSGKSSVVDAISWALYGVTARGVTGDAVVNRTAGKDCQVEVVLELNGEDIQVMRYRKSKIGKNRLVVRNMTTGVDLTLGTDKQTQELIEKMIGASLEVFQASIYAGQERLPDLPAMSDKDLKQLVEQAAGAVVLDAAHGIALERQREAKITLREASAVLASHDGEVASAENQLESHRRNADKWQEKRDAEVEAANVRTKTMLGELRELLATLGVKEVKELPSVEARLRAGIESAQAELETFHRSAPVFLLEQPPAETNPEPPSGLADLRDKLAVVSRQIIETETVVKALNGQIEQARHALSHMEAKIGTPCGECGKHYESDDLEGAKVAQLRSIEELSDKIREHMARRKKLTEANALITSRITDKETEHTAACERVRVSNAEASQSYREALQAHRAALAARDSSSLAEAVRSATAALQAFNAKSNQANMLAVEVRSVAQHTKQQAAESNPWLEAVADSERALVEVQQKSADLKQAAQDAQRNLETHEAVVQMFGPKGIRGELLDHVTPFLNARTSTYLSELSDGQISAVWETLGETAKGEVREKFHIKVEHKLGAEGFDGLSGGEKRKVRLAAAMALQDLVATRADMPIKLWIADEIDDALDVSGLERLMSLLEQKSREVGTVLIISHNDIGDWVRNQVVVRKVGGLGVLEEAK